MEKRVLEKVGDVISELKLSKSVDQVICSLHSLSFLLFPTHSSLFSGSIHERYRNQVDNSELDSTVDRNEWREIFYRGTSFPTLARVLLYDIASSWLSCFPLSARIHVYDIFFVHGIYTEILQSIVPCLRNNGNNTVDNNAIHLNAERLLELCLFENNGVLRMAREFDIPCQSDEFFRERLKLDISRVAQLVASIPDKAQFRGPSSLSPNLFFKNITIQLLSGAEELDIGSCEKSSISDENNMDGSLLFIGETFARICRRGSAELLLSELIPRILGHVRSLLLLNITKIVDMVESYPGSKFWLKLIKAIKDPYAVERLSEQILHQLATLHVSNEEAYWVLWILFQNSFHHRTSVRSMFVDKFLQWKVFPICCLKWILQFAVLKCPPNCNALTRGQNCSGITDTVQRLVSIWSKQEFVQSASLEQQAYITAALGLSVEMMSKEELNATKDVMHSILQGVSCRLENPDDLVRRMASCIALVFSKIVDPKNPLYLDDSFNGDTIDWEFSLTSPAKSFPTSYCTENIVDKIEASAKSIPDKELNCTDDEVKYVKDGNKKLLKFKVVDPDEIIDPETLNLLVSDDDEANNLSENSESTNDSSLQSYDLLDDDTDLKRKFSQLVDVIGALRKSDDPDGVEMALDVAEKLVRASPDELVHMSGDLSRTLVQVRCSDLTVEGEEESAEEKRQKALVALLVTCPFESLETLNKLIYSPNVDTSQRILILDVMTDAAEELTSAKTRKIKHQQKSLISTISESQSWFLPSSVGPHGAGSWEEISQSPLNYSYRYERKLLSKPSQIKLGKTRRWSLRSTGAQENQMEWSQNKFPLYAAAFMLPCMQGFDKKRHGVDLLGRDFIVLGKLVHMLGVCMKCTAMHPEASALALPLLDMLSSREICHHVEAYVRRSVLFAASCILLALHPSYVASALVEGNPDISTGLEWIRKWALHVVESDTDNDCYMMGMKCLQLHAEMALQASRAMESENVAFQAQGVDLTTKLSKLSIKLP